MTANDEEPKLANAPSKLCHSVNYVANGLEISASSVRRMIRSGELEAIKIGTSRRITDASYRRVGVFGTKSKKASINKQAHQ